MIQHLLLQALSTGTWASLEQLQSVSGLSGPVLADELAGLQQLGLRVEHDRQQGYRLSEPLQLLDREQILSGLRPQLRERLAVFDLQLVIDSTNTQAMRWLQAGAGGHGVFLAEKQEQGRGRRGRRWVSPLARNLMLSVVWPVPSIQMALGGLSLVTALSLVDGLREANLQGMEALQVKWPNDVWLQQAKLAGILLEYHGGQTGEGHVIIGMGLNVSLPMADRQGIEQAVTDLAGAGNQQVDRNRLTASVLNCLGANLDQFAVAGFEPFRRRWSDLDALQGREVVIHGERQQLAGRVAGVSDSGALILQTAQGEHLVHGGEVAPSVRPRD